MIKVMPRKKLRKQKHLAIRKKIFGTAECPRLCVYRSLKNIYAQIINDEKETTLVSCSTLEKELKNQLKFGGNVDAAKIIGQTIAKRALENNVTTVVFDRGGLKYHGRIKELADAARKAGLKF
jgi:large subunit ribosomal protein L18